MDVEIFGLVLRVYRSGKIYKDFDGVHYEVRSIVSTDGLKYIELQTTNGLKVIPAHHIIAFAYLDFPLNSKIQKVKHISQNLLDNRVDNLRVI